MTISKPDPRSEGKIEFAYFLSASGYRDISIPTERTCTYDLSAVLGDKTYYFELKNRTNRKPLKADQYGDNIIQMDKLQRLLDLQDEKHRCYIVNFFEDCVYINSISKPYTIQKHNCCKTTSWGGPRIEKDIVSWKHQVCQRIEY